MLLPLIHCNCDFNLSWGSEGLELLYLNNTVYRICDPQTEGSIVSRTVTVDPSGVDLFLPLTAVHSWTCS